MKMQLVKWLISSISPSMKAPDGGIGGWLAMKLMSIANPPATREALRRLKTKEEDVFVELGAGAGESLKAFANEQQDCVLPKRIVCVDISPDFRDALNAVKATLPFAGRVEIYPNDAKDLSFLQDESVDKMLAMNVIYFLDPLAEYLRELHRVIKPDGVVVFGGNFDNLPKGNKDFVNMNQEVILQQMRDAGFKSSSVLVEVGGGLNFYEVEGKKLGT